MVCVGVGIENVLDVQAIARGEGEVVIRLAAVRINDDRIVGVGTTDQIGKTSAAADLFKNDVGHR